jgi:hypothetical protein
MPPSDPPKPSSEEARQTRVAAARTLGQRLDRGVEVVAGVPRPIVWSLFVAAVLGTSPLVSGEIKLAGLETGNPVLAWVVQLSLLALAVTVAVGCFFVVRAVVAYLEEGRWPQRAGGVDVGEHDAALDQVERGAEELSRGADAFRALERQLTESNRVIRYLMGELDRARGTPPEHGAEEPGAEERGS